MAANKEIKFTVDSLLASELGERLVTKNYIARADFARKELHESLGRTSINRSCGKVTFSSSVGSIL